jgi:hypothetical protein
MAAANEHGRPRSGKGKFVEDPAAQARDAEALRMRAKGETNSVIAVALGYYDAAAADKAIKRRLAEVKTPAAEEARQLMDLQLDEIFRRAVAVMDSEHFALSGGQIIYHPDDNEFGDGPRTPLRDDAPVLAAIDRVLKIQARRAALWGLDAPTQQRLTVQSVKVTVDGADDV